MSAIAETKDLYAVDLERLYARKAALLHNSNAVPLFTLGPNAFG